MLQNREILLVEGLGPTGSGGDENGEPGKNQFDNCYIGLKQQAPA